jgi:hypothetical protein
MEFKETKVIDQIRVLEHGEVLVREATRVYKGEELISTNYHRSSILPGQDYSSQPENVQAICATAHTADVVANYAAMIEQSKGV